MQLLFSLQSVAQPSKGMVLSSQVAAALDREWKRTLPRCGRGGVHPIGAKQPRLQQRRELFSAYISPSVMSSVPQKVVTECRASMATSRITRKRDPSNHARWHAIQLELFSSGQR